MTTAPSEVEYDPAPWEPGYEQAVADQAAQQPPGPPHTRLACRRRSQDATCTRCSTPIWYGRDDDICATDAKVNKHVITPEVAEILLLNGRSVYIRDWSGLLWRLDLYNYAGSYNRDRLLAEHVCRGGRS